MKLISKSKRIGVGDPVDVSSGVMYTAWHDFDIPGYIPISWRRFYSTANLKMTSLGIGWTTPFFMYLNPTDDRMSLIDEEGQEVLFKWSDETKSSLNSEHQMTLSRENETFIIQDWHHRRRYYFSYGPINKKYQIRRIEDYSGNSILIKYDNTEKIYELEQQSTSRTIAFTYTGNRLISEIKLHAPGGRPQLLVQYKYDSRGHLAKAIDPLGNAVTYAYDDKHRLVREQNQIGGTFYFEYDAKDRCKRSWGDNGYLERNMRYDPQKGITWVTDSRGAGCTYFYNSDGIVTKSVDPMGNISRNQVSVGISLRTNALGYVTQKEFDQRNNLIKHTGPLGLTHSYSYNELGLCTSIVDPDGNVRNWEYDERGLLVRYVDPLGNAWEIDRGKKGEILCETDPEGRKLRRRYGPNLRWLEISDSLGSYRCEYDIRGKPIQSSDANGAKTIFKTDAAGQIISITLPDESIINYTYDPAGNLIRIQYLDDTVWRIGYDAFGNVISATDPDGAVERITYDTEGRRIKVTNRLDEIFQEKHDLCGRPIARKYFDERVERFEYDAAGQLIKIRRANGTVLRRKYDAYGNLLEEGFVPPANGSGPDGTDKEEVLNTYECDCYGKILNAKNQHADIGFTYDACGRVASEWQNDFRLFYTYDRSGKLTCREIENSKQGKVTFEYNPAGLLQAICDENGVVQKFAYDESGLLRSRKLGSGCEESFEYDNRKRLVHQSVISSSYPLVKRKYTYDRADNLIALNDNLRGMYQFTYDHRSWLIKSTRNTGEIEEFSFDSCGNLLKQNGINFEYGAGSHLTSMNNLYFGYDANGNQTWAKKTDNVTYNYYDEKERLSKIQLPDGKTISFSYDPIGRRILKQSDDRTLHFIWSNNKLAGYVIDDEDFIELLIGCGRWRPSVQWVNQDAQHIICNQIGTPQEIIDAKGNILWWARYDTFGTVIEEHCEDPEKYNLRFPGQFEDRETGLYYNTYRYYSAEQTRYLTPDPIGIDGGLNLYDYPRNPHSLFDPLGLKCPNPERIMIDDFNGWEVFRHDDGSMTIRVDCRRGFSNASPNRRVLRGTVHTGEDNAINLPEAHLGKDGRVIVMEGQHRSAAASRGAQIPPDEHNPHLGGVPGRPGYMEYEYSPQFDDPNQTGVPLQDLEYPPEYPHQLPSG